MARTTPLRAVSPGEKAAPAKLKTITEAAARGTERELLVATRDRIAKAVEDHDTSPRDLSSLTKRMMEIVREIKAIDARDAEGSSDRADVGDDRFDAAAL
jgi:hypothetical protein